MSILTKNNKKTDNDRHKTIVIIMFLLCHKRLQNSKVINFLFLIDASLDVFFCFVPPLVDILIGIRTFANSNCVGWQLS